MAEEMDVPAPAEFEPKSILKRNSVSPVKRQSTTRIRVRDFRALRSSLYLNNKKGQDTMTLRLRSLYVSPRAVILPIATLLNIFGPTLYEVRGARGR